MRSTERFSDRVADYVRARPGYPPELVALVAELHAPPADVADIGSGTGISTSVLLDAGYRVHAVEPNAAMRAAAEYVLDERSDFTSVPGTAEVTGLADSAFDLVTVGQAFHWFDAGTALAEFRRILRPGGWVVLFWNSRRLSSTPFLRGYEELLLRYGTDYAAVTERHASAGPIDELFAPSPVITRTFATSQRLDYPGLEARLLSSSYVPVAGQLQHAPMLVALRALFDRHAERGEVEIEYDLRVYAGH